MPIVIPLHVELKRRVRTPRGATRFHADVGSAITDHHDRVVRTLPPGTRHRLTVDGTVRTITPNGTRIDYIPYRGEPPESARQAFREASTRQDLVALAHLILATAGAARLLPRKAAAAAQEDPRIEMLVDRLSALQADGAELDIDTWSQLVNEVRALDAESKAWSPQARAAALISRRAHAHAVADDIDRYLARHRGDNHPALTRMRDAADELRKVPEVGDADKHLGQANASLIAAGYTLHEHAPASHEFRRRVLDIREGRGEKNWSPQAPEAALVTHERVHADNVTPDVKRMAFDARLHPRDMHGRFATVGSTVRIGHDTGTIVGHSRNGLIDVRRADGATVHVDPRTVEVTKHDPATLRGDHPAIPMAAGKFGEGDPRNDPEYLAQVEELDAKISDALQKGLDTESQHTFIDVNGERSWTPERAAVHKRIIDAIMDKHSHVPREKRAVMLGGLPGAGKSTYLKEHADELNLEVDEHGDPTNAIVINPDSMKEELLNGLDADGQPLVPSVPGLRRGEMASLVHEESSHLANLLAKRVLTEGQNVVFDITIGDGDKAATKYLSNAQGSGARDLGYHVDAAFVDTDLPTALHRAGLRHKLIEETGKRTYAGRYVPYAHITALAPRDEDRTRDGAKPRSHNRAEYDKLVLSGAFRNAHRYDSGTRTLVHDVQNGKPVTGTKSIELDALRTHLAEAHPEAKVHAPPRRSMRWSRLVEEQALIAAHDAAHSDSVDR